MKGYAGWYCLAGRADSCQGVCFVVVVSWHIEELASLEIPTELLHEETVTRHVCIFGVPVARRLLDHQVRVTIAEDPANAEFFGKPEPVNERLVLGDVVGGGEVDLQCVFELVAFRGSEDNAGSQARAHLGTVKMHPPMGGIRRWR